MIKPKIKKKNIYEIRIKKKYTNRKLPFLGKNSLNCFRVGCKPGIFILYGNSSSQKLNTTVVNSCGCFCKVVVALDWGGYACVYLFDLK